VESFKFFYPDADSRGFQPDVVDFFSALRTYIDVGSGHAGGFIDAPLLYVTLKRAISHMLVQRVRESEEKIRNSTYLRDVVAAGNIAITSNWDILLERYAQLHGVPLRYTGTEPDSFTLLKLHGSVDWCLGCNMKKYPDSDFAELRERLFSARSYTIPLRPKERDDCVFRIRGLEEWGNVWQRIRSRGREPHIVTMVRGKSGDLFAFGDSWQSAYDALSRAKRIEIVGYSLPDDDIEIRTLLRSGAWRGPKDPQIVVKNPSPDVHNRVRQLVFRNIVSDYTPVLS
jgi:hypothetical protein